VPKPNLSVTEPAEVPEPNHPVTELAEVPELNHPVTEPVEVPERHPSRRPKKSHSRIFHVTKIRE